MHICIVQAWEHGLYTKSKTRSRIGNLAIHPDDPKSELTSNDNEKAEILSTFFSRVFRKVPNGDIPQYAPLTITVAGVTKLTNKLEVDKYSSPDQIHVQPHKIS